MAEGVDSLIDSIKKSNKFSIVSIRINNWIKSKKEKTPLTSEQTLEKIFKEENDLYEFTSRLLPFIIGITLAFLWVNSLTNTNSDFLLFIFPLYAFVIPFFISHWRILYNFPKARKANSSKSYFENLTFERAYLRFRHIERLYRMSIVILIVVSLFVIISLHYTNQTIEDNRKNYENQLSEYNTSLDKINNASDDEIKQFLLIDVSEMTESRKKTFLKNLFVDKFVLQAENNNDPELEKNAWGMASNKVEKMNIKEITAAINNEVNSMTSEQVLELTLAKVNSKKPYNYFYENEYYSKQYNFLLSLALLPISMFYSLYICKQFFRQKDFFYNSCIGCFKIMIAINQNDEIRKRQYLKLGIEQYEKFLKKTLNLRFDKIYNIESKLLNESPLDIDNTGKIILEKLEKKHHLSLSEYFAEKLKKNTDSILITDPLVDKLKELLPLIATIVSSVIAAVGFFVSVISPTLKP